MRRAEPTQPPTEGTVALVVHLRNLPPTTFREYAGIEVGIGKKHDAIAGVKEKGGLRFAAEAKATLKKGRFVLTGPYAFGTPDDRFLYLVWSAEAGGARAMFRRLKIKLDMPDALVEAALAKGAPLHVTMHGTSRDGGPACATQPPLEAWALP